MSEGIQRSACAHCDAKAAHPQFACLLSSTPPPGTDGVHTSSWDSDRQPLWQLKCHNRDRRYVRGAKATKFGAPHHVNALVIGPFTANADAFVRVMKANNRKFKNRLVRGVRLAQLWHHVDAAQGASVPLRIWCPNDADRVRVRALLEENALDEHATLHMTSLVAAAARELAVASPLTLACDT